MSPEFGRATNISSFQKSPRTINDTKKMNSSNCCPLNYEYLHGKDPLQIFDSFHPNFIKGYCLTVTHWLYGGKMLNLWHIFLLIDFTGLKKTDYPLNRFHLPISIIQRFIVSPPQPLDASRLNMFFWVFRFLRTTLIMKFLSFHLSLKN